MLRFIHDQQAAAPFGFVFDRCVINAFYPFVYFIAN